MKIRSVISALTVVGIAAFGFAATHGAAAALQSQDTVKLSDIVITATKLPAPASATGHAVTVITGADLREHGVRRVVDALRTVPGVAVAQLGGMGAVASVFMRGGESDYVQVLIDGVQVNDPGGSYDWAHLTTDDIERIEIVRGPASVLYGSDAVAGVVQIFTHGAAAGRGRGAGTSDAARAHHMRAGFLGGRGARVGVNAAGAPAAGSYDALDWNASVGGAFDFARSTKFTYGATASQLRSDGAYAFNNEYDNRTVSARAALRAQSRGDVEVTARRTSQTFHYPTTGAGFVRDRNKFTDGSSLAIGASAGYFVTSHVEARAQLASYRSETGGSNPADEPGEGFDESSADVRRNTAELRINAYLPHDIVTTFGVEGERQRGATTFDSDGAFGPFSSESSAKRSNTAYYAQLMAAPTAAINASAGVRVDDNRQFGSFTTGRASASVRVASAVRIRGALGTGFKEPTFIEAYSTGFAIGDPDLRPEESRSIEIGTDIGPSRARVGVSWFDQSFRNLIQYTFAAPEGSPNYFNIGRARASGMEVTAHADPARILSLDGQYTYVRTRVNDDGFGGDRAFVDGARLLRRPSHQASIMARVQPADAVTTTATLNMTGERDDLDFTDPADFAGRRVVLAGYATVDASATYRLPSRLAGAELLVRVSNLLDRRYDEVYNFPAAGRLVWVGASITMR